jgi:hypothetical protein
MIAAMAMAVHTMIRRRTGRSLSELSICIHG